MSGRGSSSLCTAARSPQEKSSATKEIGDVCTQAREVDGGACQKEYLSTLTQLDVFGALAEFGRRRRRSPSFQIYGMLLAFRKS